MAGYREERIARLLGPLISSAFSPSHNTRYGRPVGMGESIVICGSYAIGLPVVILSEIFDGIAAFPCCNLPYLVWDLFAHSACKVTHFFISLRCFPDFYLLGVL